ncbi:WW domain-binding protein 11 isoform X1 [Tripterygium wilfordii]|uniref:WW domain-binding protein 11 isoform X1 n=1 Tax=Tripterygium wilfordii TaxID=458696 RepID=A0A7J7DLC1_TRIWF|nr:transcriptional regulator DEF1 [Tripterygium wilfordii]KAF5746886.1 WW domain-binding protein 11 isoform X1 [Tripterygium wilfordii]
MNPSQYMDKQIMDPSSSSTSVHHQGSLLQDKSFIDLMNHPSQEDGDHDGATDNLSDDDNGIKRSVIFPSYDFQPIRPISTSSPKLDGVGAGSARVWSSAESKINSTANITRNYSSLDTIEPAKVIVEKEQNVFGAGIVAEIDRVMKKHTDNLLHVMEGVSTRLTQLESQTRNLENSMDDLKMSFGNNQGSTDGKMRHLENILREVQTGVEDLKYKQEGVEAQLRLYNMQVSKVEKHSENQNTGHMDTAQAASALPQSYQQLPPATFPQSIPPLVMPPSVPLPPVSIPQQNPPHPAQLPNQFPQNQTPSVPQRDPYYLPSGQAQEAPAPKYQAPPSQQPQLSPAAPPHQPYQPAPQPQYPQPPQPTQPSQLQPSLGHHPEETPYMPHQNYPPNLRQPPSQPSTGSSPSQQYYEAPSHLYEPPSNRSGSGFSSGYGQPAVSESYPFSGQPSQYGSSSPRKPQLSTPPVAQIGGSGYPQLPTARVLPQALPTASGVGSGSSAAGSGNRVPVDDVIDKVSSMGFPRDHVRATVRKLTENGQSVDLNVVLDKLMNDGEFQPPRGWFGR